MASEPFPKCWILKKISLPGYSIGNGISFEAPRIRNNQGRVRRRFGPRAVHFLQKRRKVDEIYQLLYVEEVD
jgi:hypothetical protein